MASMTQTREKIYFRMFQMPCCGQALCWVNPRLPNYCPECGKSVFWEVKSGTHTVIDSPNSWLIVEEESK